jgi:hypothetical protein
VLFGGGLLLDFDVDAVEGDTGTEAVEGLGFK